MKNTRSFTYWCKLCPTRVTYETETAEVFGIPNCPACPRGQMADLDDLCARKQVPYFPTDEAEAHEVWRKSLSFAEQDGLP